MSDLTRQPPCESGIFYTIRAGDTLFAIARRFNVSLDELIRVNPGIDPNNLRIGQRICIPRAIDGECPEGSFAYTIRSGDTLFRLAQRFNTTVNAILEINAGIDPNNLRIGQVICIPGQEPGVCGPGTREYTIQAGDTFFRLAQRFGVGVDEIIRANPGVDPNRLRIGQVVCIPIGTQPNCPGGTIYNVRPGDTLFNIARRNNITLERLLQANPQIQDPDNISVGQPICIPGRATVQEQSASADVESRQQPDCPGGRLYTIRAGDTFFTIARRFNVSVDELMDANPDVEPDRLRIGQVICIPGVDSDRCPRGTMPYVIRAGDTYFAIARRFGTTVQALIDANPGVDPNNLQIGQTICVPVAPGPGRCPRGTFEYTVQAGDTFYSLAQRFNTTVVAIAAANPGVDPDNLRVGQIICIPRVPDPGPRPCPRGTFAYTVRAGDTFYSLAQQFDTTVEAIRRANPGVDPDNLRVGQIICIPGSPQPRCPRGTFEYTVRAGDTFFRLAQRFNTTVEAIRRANPDVDPDNLRVGQIICIPETSEPGRCPRGTFEYTVRAGDTFFRLAQRFNTTVEAIRRANPDVDPDNLRVGQIICIPETSEPGRCPRGTFEYTVRAGDTFFRLAQRFNTTVEAIRRANPDVDPDNLRVGQIICIPETSEPGRCPRGTFEYTVRAGDTFFRLAQRFNTTVEAIRRANPDVDPDNLRVGQIICIPETSEPGRCPRGTFEYTVRAGDTFFRLAQRFNTTVEAIRRANPDVDPDNLRVGQIICIPRT